MPSLIDIRRRIRSTKSTQQITKAMKMVSSSKLRRAQERIVNSRPYAHEMLRVFNNLATRVDPSTHPLLNDDPTPGRTLLVVITADRGLCGGFNANVIKGAAQFLAERKAGTGADQADLREPRGRPRAGRPEGSRLLHAPWLRRAVRRGQPLQQPQVVARAGDRQDLHRRVPGPDVSSVYLVYNEFRSVISQRVVIERLLPIPKLEPQSPAMDTVDYLFEPSPDRAAVNTLLPYHVSVQVARALLESSAAEHAARMTAMDAATRNAKDMVDRLTLYMNKVRQASITREIIEIVAGAQSV